LAKALATITSQPAKILEANLGAEYASLGQLVVGGVADICIFDPKAAWTVSSSSLRSQGKHTPFISYELPGKVVATLVAGHVAFEG
jgi:dihydroorotase